MTELVAVARRRAESSVAGSSSRGFWFGIWLIGDVESALDGWQESLHHEVCAADVLLRACSDLLGEMEDVAEAAHQRWTPSQARRLISWAHHELHMLAAAPKGRAGSIADAPITNLHYDRAMRFPDALRRRVAYNPLHEATSALEDLIADPRLRSMKDRLAESLDDQLSRRADSHRWRPTDIRSFEDAHEVDPVNDASLFQIVMNRINDIKKDVECSDTGLRLQVRYEDDERHLRSWLANELSRRANRRYVVAQEAVVDREQRPDITLQNPRAGSVCIEIKWAHTCSPATLVKGLEVQLVGQYLRAHNSRCGIYVIAVKGLRVWKSREGRRVMDFNGIVEMLQSKATEILSRDRSRTKQLAVIGIDFREPSLIEGSVQTSF